MSKQYGCDCDPDDAKWIWWWPFMGLVDRNRVHLTQTLTVFRVGESYGDSMAEYNGQPQDGSDGTSHLFELLNTTWGMPSSSEVEPTLEV